MKAEKNITKDFRIVGNCGLIVFIVFLVLKLVGVINWSWWWVTSPFWILTGIALLVGAVAFIISIIKLKTGDNK
jgi:hypothetical protein